SSPKSVHARRRSTTAAVFTSGRRIKSAMSATVRAIKSGLSDLKGRRPLAPRSKRFVRRADDPSPLSERNACRKGPSKPTNRLPARKNREGGWGARLPRALAPPPNFQIYGATEERSMSDSKSDHMKIDEPAASDPFDLSKLRVNQDFLAITNVKK